MFAQSLNEKMYNFAECSLVSFSLCEAQTLLHTNSNRIRIGESKEKDRLRSERGEKQACLLLRDSSIKSLIFVLKLYTNMKAW